MIDIKDLRERPEYYKTSATSKGFDGSLIDQILVLDESRRKLTTLREELKAKQNVLAKSVPTLTGAAKEKALVESKDLSNQVKKYDEELIVAEKKLLEVAEAIPNPIHESVHLGKSDAENTVARTVGTPTKFDFKPKEHWEIAEDMDILDLERGAKVSGSRFYYLKNDLVFLEFALVQFVMRKLVEKGFTPMITPFLVRERAMWGTGFFPADKNEIYTVNPGEDNLFLVGTSEVTLVNYHDNETLDASKLPLRYVGYSSCFRREAGSYGKDMKGMIRVHQFEKVEMVSFVDPEKSWEEHEFLRECEEEILQDLGLPYQVVNICSGDLGASAAKKYDLEGWFPGQEKYRELTSTSNTTDYQARRLNIKYRNSEGKLELVHILNGTATSMRPLAAIIENYQEKDGSIIVPEVLRMYMGKDKITKLS